MKKEYKYFTKLFLICLMYGVGLFIIVRTLATSSFYGLLPGLFFLVAGTLRTGIRICLQLVLYYGAQAIDRLAHIGVARLS